MFAAFKSQPVQRLILPLLLLLALASYAWRGRVVDNAATPTTAMVAAPERSAAPLARKAESAASTDSTVPAATVEPRTASAPGIAHRATVDQRQRDRERLDSDPDLVGLEAELEARAQVGDADAATALADMLQKCALNQIGIEDGSYDDGRELQLLGGLDAEVMALLRAQSNQLAGRCRSLGVASVDQYSEQIQAWLQRAAALGDPAARLRVPTGPQTGADAPAVDRERRRLAAELLSERGPDALARYALTLWVVSGGYDESAFVLAACTLIAACASDPPTYALQDLLNGQGSEDGGVGYFRLLTLTPREQLIAAGQSAVIVRLWRAGQFEQLMAPHPRPRRPGAP